MEAEWERLRLKDHSDIFTANTPGNLFLRTCCDKRKNCDERTWAHQRVVQVHREVMCLLRDLLLL